MSIQTTPTDKNHPHSEYGASAAKRWRTCPGSVAAIRKAKAEKLIPENNDSEYSDEGQEAHDYAEKVLNGKMELAEVPDEIRHHITGYINLCNAITSKALAAQGEVYVEDTVNLYYRPQDVGTVDFAGITNDWLQFVDLKYGKGVQVRAEGNDQQIVYCGSFIRQIEEKRGEELPDDMPVLIGIYQPRHYKFTGYADVWETTVREIKDICIDIENDYLRAQDDNGSFFNPSFDTCQFCDINGICGARQKQLIDPLTDFDDETQTPQLLNQGTMTREQIAFIINNAKDINKLCKDVLESEEERIKDGGELLGFKMVENPRKGSRVWVDEKAAETFLKGQLSVEERFCPRKLISAPQAIAKLKANVDEMSTVAKLKMGMADKKTAEKSKTECLFHQPDGKPKLVPIDAEGEATVYETVEEDFEDETTVVDEVDFGDLM